MCQVLMAASIMSAVFCVVAPCGLVEVYRRLRGASCLQHQALMMEAAIISGTSVNFYQTTQHINTEHSL
jgi:hypothetical protein